VVRLYNDIYIIHDVRVAFYLSIKSYATMYIYTLYIYVHVAIPYHLGSSMELPQIVDVDSAC